MFRSRALTAAVIASALLTAGCSDDDSADIADEATAVAAPGDPTTGPLPFVDDFDDDTNGWGGTYQRFEDGAYVWNLPAGQRDVRAADALIRTEDHLDDITVTTTVRTRGIEAVGVQCAFEEREGSSRWYDLELGRSGVTIRKRDLGTAPVETLASDADVTLRDGAEVVIEALCLRSTEAYSLRLIVDGSVAAEVSDPEPFGRAGAPNLVVVATAADGGHVAEFDRFEVTSVDG